MPSADATHDDNNRWMRIKIGQCDSFDVTVPVLDYPDDKERGVISRLSILRGIKPHAKATDGAGLKVSLGDNGRER